MSGFTGRRARSMQFDLFNFVGFRLASGGLSFMLFALLAKWFAADEAKTLFFLLFLLGFFTSALRAMATVATAIKEGDTRSAKIRRVAPAYGQVMLVGVMMLPAAIWATSNLGLPFWAYPSITVLLLTWGLDTDILRAVLGRSSLVAAAGVVGAVLAISVAVKFRSIEGAVAAILLQWLPICLLNLIVLFRWHRRIFRGAIDTLSHLGAKVWGPLTVALFEGGVLNTVFFMGALIPPDLGLSIGIVTRIFATAMILMPLIIFWSNGKSMGKIGHYLRLPIPAVYAGLVLVSGLAAGSSLAIAFALISGVPPKAYELGASALLLFGYSFYTTASRYCGQLSKGLISALFVLAAINVTSIIFVITVSDNALPIACIQAVTLLVAAGLIARFRPALH